MTNSSQAVEVTQGKLTPRDDSSSGTLYFKFRVDPQSDVLSELRGQSYLAGLVFRHAGVDGMGVGNASNAWGYSLFAPSFRFPGNKPGELTLRTDKPEIEGEANYLAPRRGVRTTIIIKIDYVPGGEDVVTLWLNPDLSPGATEGGQPDGIVSRFKANASFDQLHYVHHGPGDGWVFDQLAVATAFEDFVPVPWWRQGWVMVLAGLGMACLVIAAVISVERRRARRQLAAMEREQAVVAERVRIAQDLHDDLGAKVTEIVLLGELAKGGSGRDSLPAMLEGLRELHASLDEAVWSINPRNDSLADLVEFVSEYAQRFLQHAPVEFHLERTGTLPEIPLSASQRHNLTSAVKEALNNAVRHAAAKTIRLGFAFESPHLRVTVTDDGCGFSGDPEAGDGLRNLKARLEAIGGHTEIRSTPGEGTVVTFVLPLSI